MIPVKNLKPIKIITSFKQEKQVLEQYIKQKAKADDSENELDILEAGCGRTWWLDLGNVNYKLTGVDLDTHALNFRKYHVKDLDESIEGDLCSVKLENNRYDVIFNAYVLEHIMDANRVLENFKNWLKPGGLLILQFPDRGSAYGFITRFTPHWIHVLYVRYFAPWNNKDAGKQGHGPYPTFYAPVVSRAGIEGFCKASDFSIEAEYGSNRYLTESSGIKAALMKLIVWAVYFLSLGNLDPRYSNLIYVLKKRPDFAMDLKLVSHSTNSVGSGYR